MNEELVDFVVDVLHNVFGALGLLGNALVVLVLTRPQMRSPFSCLLLALAACDVTYILFVVLMSGPPCVLEENFDSRWRYYHVYIRPDLVICLYPLINVTQTMSVYLSVLMSVERWVAVCYPLRAKELFTYSRTLWYILATAIFAFAFNVTGFFEYKLITVNDSLHIWTVNKSLITNWYLRAYHLWLSFVVMFIVPFSLLNACVVRGVRRAQAQRARLTRVQRSELGLTVLMLVDVLVFSVCSLPVLSIIAFRVYLPKCHSTLLSYISYIFVTFNCSINFGIYIIFSKKFRKEFLKIFNMNKFRRRPL